MIVTCSLCIFLLSLVLVLTTFVQTLYLESLRLRTRELPALMFFRDSLEERIGMRAEQGALVFSLVKHIALVLLGVFYVPVSLSDKSLGAALFQACLLTTINMLVVAYVLPQVLYRKTSGAWILPLLPVLKVLMLAARPLAWLLGFLQSITELGEERPAVEENGTQAENIEALISAGAEEGLIEEEDKRLIQSVVEFGDKTVREVMTPRPNIVAIGLENSLEDLRQLVINEQYSRIPVFEGNIDQIRGFIHVRDMFELDDEERAKRTVRELMRPIRFVPETKRVKEMLREMQDDGTHMAIVVDEYGNTAGLATMEDMVEEIFGEIRDEHEPAKDVTPESGGAFVVSGSYDVDGLYDLLQFRPLEETESTTVGGLVTEWMGRVPRKGEVVEREGIRMEVLAGSDLRVERVRVSRAVEHRGIG